MLRRHHQSPEAAGLSENERRRVPVLVALLLVALLWLCGGGTLQRPPRPQPPSELTAPALEQQARAYFAAWNTKDSGVVAGLFQEAGTLRDWDVSAKGASRVAEANAAIWAAVPGIAIEILAVHPSPTTRTVVCEVLVRLNDADGTVLKVTDVIEYGADMRISSLRAYKG